MNFQHAQFPLMSFSVSLPPHSTSLSLPAQLHFFSTPLARLVMLIHRGKRPKTMVPLGEGAQPQLNIQEHTKLH